MTSEIDPIDIGNSKGLTLDSVYELFDVFEILRNGVSCSSSWLRGWGTSNSSIPFSMLPFYEDKSPSTCPLCNAG